MGTLIFCLALNIGVGFYLHLWQPLTNLVKAFQMKRQISAWRVAGLLMLILMVHVTPVHAQGSQTGGYVKQCISVAPHSDGDDALVAKWTIDNENGGITGVPTIDNALLYVWNNSGKLMLVFGLLALASILNSKLKAGSECYGDVLRREAADRWEEEQGDDIHNPFNSPEGMQPTTQYVPVRSRLPFIRTAR